MNYVDYVAPGLKFVLILLIFQILAAVIKLLVLTKGSRVKVVVNAGKDLAELPTVEFRGFPVSLNVAALRRDKFVEQLGTEQMVEWRA